MKRIVLTAVVAAIVLALGTAVAGGAGHRHGRHHHRGRPKPAPAPALTKYSIVNGCYELTTNTGQKLGPYRMQATTLAEYLLYDAQQTFLGAGLATESAPSPSAVWRVDGSSPTFTITNIATGESFPVSFAPASGCAIYPEGQLDATGPTFTGSSPEAAVSGTIDAHTHVTAFEFLGGDFHCGRPWDPYGIPYALPNCAPYEQGSNGQVESFLDYGAPAHQHDTVGWPTFHDWPSPTDLAEEGDYYTGIKRAWMAGLRVMVTQLVDNEALCQLMTVRRNPCNDMSAVVLQAKDLHELQDYIDAQSGGPGKGFFRIVTNPFQARQVINQGKLAVVMGIEVSHLFNCGEYMGTPQCSESQIDAGLKQVHDLGVSTFFPIHKFDNAFGGTKMDSGETGELVNAGNHLETGQFWNIQTCTGPEHDSTQLNTVPPGALGTLMQGAVGNTLLPTGNTLPVYPPPPHCNTRGLTDLGAYLIKQMIKQHFIVELDHMDVKTADAALSIIEAQHYSGVISAHSWDSPEQNPRIYNLGGFVTPIAGASPASFLDQWHQSLAIRNKRFYDGTGFGYGADMNGLAEESQPTSGHPITYPFTSNDGKVTFNREQWGQRVFDINTDGVANYGMFPDWLQELKTLAGPAILTDMFHGAEAYLEMWERAYGVQATSCRPATGRIGASGAGPVRIGDSFQTLLYAAGQPASRPGTAYRWCVTGSSSAAVSAVFGARGTVAMVASNARGYRAGWVRVGSRARHGIRRTRSLGHGLWLGRRMKGGARYLYGVRHGRVRWVAVVTRGEARHVRVLRRAARASGVA